MIEPASPSLPPREEVPRAVAELLADLLRRPWREVGARHYLAEYLRAERLPAEALRARQLAGLRRIAWHCFLEVPRHAVRIGALLKPAELERLDDPARLPIGRADERRREPGAYQAKSERIARRLCTAGRLGAPLEVLLDAESVARREAVRMRAESWAGAPPARLIAAWGRDALHAAGPLDPGDRAELAAARAGFVLSAPADGFDQIAAAMDLRRRPRALIARGPDAEGRAAALAERTGAPLHRFYGAAEVGLIASSCERGGMHVHADHLLLEVVDGAGRPCPPGEPGSLLVTDLHNRAAPFLRHELSDRGRLLDRGCACGRALPLVELDAGA